MVGIPGYLESKTPHFPQSLLKDQGKSLLDAQQVRIISSNGSYVMDGCEEAAVRYRKKGPSEQRMVIPYPYFAQPWSVISPDST